MRIGVFLGSVAEHTGGEHTFQAGLMQSLELIETRHELFVFYYGRANPKLSGRRTTYVPLLDNLWPLRQVRRMLAAVRGRQASVLQQAAEQWRIDLLWFPSLHFAPLDIPYICTVFDLEHRLKPFFPEVSADGNWEWRERLFGPMVRRAAYTICGTEAGKREILDFYQPGPERVRVIPFPVPPFALEKLECGGDFFDRHGIRRPYLFYPAQFWPHKNHVALLHAQKLLRDRHGLELDLVLCGSDKGNLEHVRQTARALGLEERVRFLGFVTQPELSALYREAFALVFPSMFGPDNLPPLEAFALGCPVVTGRLAGSEEQLGDAALLVDYLNEEEIAAAVLRLHAEADFRATLVRRGKERATRWTTRDYVGAILTLCDEFAAYRRCWSSEKPYVLG